MTLSTKTILSYTASSAAFHLIAGAHSFYYVKVFMNLYKIDESWFQFSQFVYLLWNAVNDPLFAYIQDSTNLRFTRTRRESIMYVGPMFAISFMLPWIQIGQSSWTVGLHLIVSLFVWDTLFTFVGLAHCALSTELSIESADRISLNRFGNIGSLIGSSSVLILEYASDGLRDFRSFQITAALISTCSLVLFIYVGRNAHTFYDYKRASSSTTNDMKNISHSKATEESYWKQLLQILSDKNFLSFVIANFCQEFHRAFLSNFMAILGDHLIPESDVSHDLKKFFYGAVRICPQASFT